jgi:ABC-2 type transport system ATP-binding protein
MISLDHVTKLYGTVIGLNDVTVEFGAGVYGLLGPNGAGKTTLLGLVTGQLRPTLGRVEVCGASPFGNPDVLRRIGYCPAADILEPRISPREWVEFLLELAGHRRASARRRAASALDEVGLGAAADRPLGTLSKGMRQRAKIAGAVAHDPELLVLDEPFVGLDPQARHDLVGLVRRWAGGRTLLVASHLLHEIEALDAGLAVILGGRLVASGDAAEIRRLVATLPGEVRVACDQPRRLAAAVCAAGLADAVRFEGAARLVLGGTRHGDLLRALPDLARDEGVVIAEIASAGRSLEDIFDRLVLLHRGVAP